MQLSTRTGIARTVGCIMGCYITDLSTDQGAKCLLCGGQTAGSKVWRDNNIVRKLLDLLCVRWWQLVLAHPNQVPSMIESATAG
jgi:hypothetical protein